MNLFKKSNQLRVLGVINGGMLVILALGYYFGKLPGWEAALCALLPLMGLAEVFILSKLWEDYFTKFVDGFSLKIF